MTTPNTSKTEVAGGYGLTRADADRLFAGSPEVAAHIRAQADQADAARTPAPAAAESEPCCPECAEKAARELAALAQATAEAAHALSIAEGEGMTAPA